jgi:hypothetical protein
MGIARPPLDLPRLLILLFIGLSAALIVWLVSFIVPLALAGQAYLLIVIVVAFRHWPPMRRWLARMPLFHRVAFGMIVGAMVAGHFSVHSRTYFPFVSWEIFPFVREEDPVSCREFLATTTSGKSVRLLVEQLFPSIVQFDPPPTDSPAMTHLVHVMATVYNQRHAADPVERVDLVRLAVKLHPSANESGDPPACEFLKTFDTSSDRSN